MPYSFIDYLKFKLYCFRYWLGFRTPAESYLDGYDYALTELLAGKEPTTSAFDRNEFDQGVTDAINMFNRNK